MMNSELQPFSSPGADRESAVDVWTVRLNATPASIEGLRQKLSADEKNRANAFRFEKHRDRFILARGLLRHILGVYLAILPEQVTFQYGPQGKPTLGPDGPQGVHFNLSHSEDCALYAFSPDFELGVDLELVREVPNLASLATRFFAAEECADLLQVPSHLLAEAFLNCWTRKEAYLKAIGKGLSEPLDSFHVPVLQDRWPVLLNLPDGNSQDSQWTLFQPTPVSGYVASLAIPSTTCFLRERAFSSVEECLNSLKHF